MPGYAYMMSNRPGGVLYTGVTSSLGARGFQHKEGAGSAFCRQYGLDRLVWYEPYERIEDAIAREKQVKKWRRAWKVKLIEEMNPGWDDLYQYLNQ